MCDINKNLEIFGKDRKSNERYASFDYCFNYFQGFNNKADIASPSNIQNSCLQLGFYLASWGMYRGSTFLLQKSVKVFEPLMTYVASKCDDIWNIDVDDYTEENISKLIKCGKEIKEKLGKHIIEKVDGTLVEKEATDTLVTKIMLGVFGNVPAYDDNFRRFLKNQSLCQTFNEESLEDIEKFYGKNEKIINNKSKEIGTLDFISGEEKKPKRSYTKAKIIDMVGFIAGQELIRQDKKQKIIYETE